MVDIFGNPVHIVVIERNEIKLNHCGIKNTIYTPRQNCLSPSVAVTHQKLFFSISIAISRTANCILRLNMCIWDIIFFY